MPDRYRDWANPENEALIAAAPDLLEACKVVLASLRVDRGNIADIHRLEAAITKAEGESRAARVEAAAQHYHDAHGETA